MRGLTVENIEKITGGVLHVSLLTRAEISATFERESLRKGSPRARWAYERILSQEVSSIVTDSRKSGKGSLFCAIVGERVDGHRFIPQVFDQGAICVLSEHYLEKDDLFSKEAVFRVKSGEGKASPMEDWRLDPKEELRRKLRQNSLPQGYVRGESEAGSDDGSQAGCGTAGGQEGFPGMAPDGCLYRFWIEVNDTQEALRKIAEAYLKTLALPVVGITGSVGKTSTKEMIASVLETHFKTLKTEGNFNNGLGLPLTVFRLRDDDQIAVLEMGVSHFGDMDQLARIARPDTMVITNIGTCHLEFLKDRDGIMRAKTEVFPYMKESGRAILNGNDDKLRTITTVNGSVPYWFGVASGSEGAEDLCVGEKQEFPGDLDESRLVCAEAIEPLGFQGSLCTLKTPKGSFRVKVPVPGIHNISNAAAAAAVGLAYGLSFEEIKTGIESMKTISGRFRIIKAEDRTIIDDCYNANPVSMKSSLAVLKDVPQGSRRVAVLGDMGELGKDEVVMHQQVGEYAAGCCDCLIAIGDLSKVMSQAAIAKNPSLKVRWYPDIAGFLSEKDMVLKAGDTILVKASHFMGFSGIVEALTS